jgi:hypothetical protein
MCTTRDVNRATASGEVHTTKVCAHPTPGPRKAGPSLDGGVLSVWVPTASRNSACARRNKGTTRLQGKGARAATTAAAPAKRPARLDDRLSSDGGSARWRERAAGNTQTTSSQGSVQPRLEGRVHIKVKGVSHLAFWTRRRGGGDEQRNGLKQRKQTGGSACCRRSRAARRHLPQVRLLPRGGDLTTDGFFLPRAAPAPGRTAMESKSQAQD